MSGLLQLVLQCLRSPCVIYHAQKESKNMSQFTICQILTFIIRYNKTKVIYLKNVSSDDVYRNYLLIYVFKRIKL